jgi:hypothetical protein
MPQILYELSECSLRLHDGCSLLHKTPFDVSATVKRVGVIL